MQYYKILVTFSDDRASIVRHVSGKNPADALANLAIELTNTAQPVASLAVDFS